MGDNVVPYSLEDYHYPMQRWLEKVSYIISGQIIWILGPHLVSKGDLWTWPGLTLAAHRHVFKTSSGLDHLYDNICFQPVLKRILLRWLWQATSQSQTHFTRPPIHYGKKTRIYVANVIIGICQSDLSSKLLPGLNLLVAVDSQKVILHLAPTTWWDYSVWYWKIFLLGEQ